MKAKRHIDVYYLIEKANWSIAEDGKNIVNHLRVKRGCVTARLKIFTNNAYIHFGSFNKLIGNIDKYRWRKGRRIVATCFHIADGDTRANKIALIDKYVEKWHTSCKITRDKLIHFGVPEDKIVVIPLGIDLTKYFPPGPDFDKEQKRSEFGIKEGQIVIGSFQKDGNGWEIGMEPKLIKGPDVFCNIIEKIALKYDVFVLLSGPARGYVKSRLDNAKIPYYHIFQERADDVAKLYHLLDVYFVTSREEGGPKAILESMASGVPLIATKVGMAPDVIINNVNGILVDVEDEDGMINAFEEIMTNKKFREGIVKEGLKTAQMYDMDKIVKRYEEELYL